MSKETKIFIGIIIGLIVFIGGLFIVNAKTPGKYDAFAQCITDSGAKFYGAFWCPHCQSQKQLFGKSAKKLPYIECSTPDKQPTAQCLDAGIKGYPTWDFITPSITYTSKKSPVECVYPYTDDQPSACKEQPLDGFKNFVFIEDNQKENKIFQSLEKPIQQGDVWEFKQTKRISGEQTFAQLAEKTGCPVPQ